MVINDDLKQTLFLVTRASGGHDHFADLHSWELLPNDLAYTSIKGFIPNPTGICNQSHLYFTSVEAQAITSDSEREALGFEMTKAEPTV